MTSSDELLLVCDDAIDGYAAVCRELGDDLVTARLDDVPGSNSAFALVAHVCGVMARWGRTVNRGIEVPRDRDAEFRAEGTVAEALGMLTRARVDLHEDVAVADPGAAPVNPPRRGSGDDPDDPRLRTQGAVLLHVYAELAQHLGHLEVTRDVLLARHRGGADSGR